jgi:putative addiction module killer protein
VIAVRQYVDLSGRNRFESWFFGLDQSAQARVTIALDRLERGNDSAAKSVGQGVHELRLDFGPGYRIYFGREGESLVILLSGGSKKRQQADIAIAKTLWGEYKARKREAAWRSRNLSTRP